MATTDPAVLDLDATLRERFGLEQFRPGQREVIEEVLRGRDVLCVMPTGGGKSLCYQLPALVRTGITLVVSPLIALMKDQVDGLQARGHRATLINSTLDPAEQLARIREVEAGRYDLVYVAPERFRSGRFLEAMGRVRPALLAVDEAHCISEWGHDFRPDYARLGLARKRLGNPPCIALTATATDLVRRDIADQLDLRDPALFVTGFDRPNLTYAVVETRREAEKLEALKTLLQQTPGSVIVYASSRARCESVAASVQTELRRSAVVYHAGLTREQRHEAQEQFMSGEVDVVVATNAFGMGVDKPDIRAVVHFNIPGTLEAYYQEAGRAGRDGLPARCLLLYAPSDRILQERFIENEYPPPEVVFQVYNTLRHLEADPIELTQAEIKEEAGIDLGETAVGTALRLLEGAGLIERFLPRENMAIVRINQAEPVEPDDAGLFPRGRPESLTGRISERATVQKAVLLGLEALVSGRYSEPIYFHPDQFAASLGLDRPALARAIRAITAELPVDYVPPFRGHATRVLDRSRNLRDLGIDFSVLKERKALEYEKLERMVRYAQTGRCRRSYLLGYFGDPRADGVHCGRCDNCGEAGGGTGNGSSVVVLDRPAAREVVLKVLSGIARAKGRFGKNIVAQMLKGSTSEKLERFGLKKLSTFNILPQFAQAELTQIIDALADAGLVDCPEVDRFRPVVNLTDAGWALLKDNERVVRLALPPELAAKLLAQGEPREARSARSAAGEGTQATSSPHEADPLYQTLKALRTEWSRAAKQPPYVIFTNETLDALVVSRPTTPTALAAIKGLGPARVERYGEALLAAIRAAENATPEPPVARTVSPTLPPPARPDPPAAPPPPRQAPSPASPRAATPSIPTELWTYRLIERGFGIDEAAAIRGLDRLAILRHLSIVARQGKPVDLAVLFSAEAVEAWDAWLAQQSVDPGPDDTAPEVWSLVLACRCRSS